MKNILIDLTGYRECSTGACDQKVPDGLLAGAPESNGLKSIRELASFTFSCRKCEDAPCISVCPEDALKKNDMDLIIRSTNLCVACKSCVVICPFGTMMSDFYEYKRTESLYFNLKDEDEREKFVKESPEGTVSYTDKEKDEENNIYELMPGILIKDYSWDKLKNLK